MSWAVAGPLPIPKGLSTRPPPPSKGPFTALRSPGSGVSFRAQGSNFGDREEGLSPGGLNTLVNAPAILGTDLACPAPPHCWPGTKRVPCV